MEQIHTSEESKVLPMKKKISKPVAQQGESGTVDELVEKISGTTIKKSELDAKAQQLKEERELPPAPQKRQCQWETAKEWLALLTDKQWERIMIYVYRLYPKIDRKLVDVQAKKYIEVISEPFNEKQFIRQHGGGKYQFRINDAGGKGTVIETVYEVPMSDYDPILDLREIELGNSDNKPYIDYLKRRGVLNADGSIPDNMAQVGQAQMIPNNQDTNVVVKELIGMVKSQQQQNNRTTPEDVAATKAIELFAKTSERAQDMLLERVKQENPSNQLDMLLKLMTLLKPEKSEAKELMLMQMMDQMMKMNQMFMQSQMEILKQQKELMNSGTHKDEGEQKTDLDRVKDIAEIAKIFKGTGPSEETLTDKLIQMGASALPGVLAILMQRGNGQPIQVPNIPLPNQPAQLNPAMPNQQDVQHMMDVKTLIKQNASTLAYMIGQGNDGVDLAETLHKLPNGEMIYKALTKDGSTNLLNELMSVDEFRIPITQIMKPEDITKIVEDFCNFETIIASEQLEDEKENEKEETTNETIVESTPVSEVLPIMGRKGKGGKK